MSSRQVKIGMAQLLVEGGEAERNFERAAKLIAAAKKEGCQIVLLPETIDFAWTHPRSTAESLPIPGPHSDFFCQLAREHGIYICVGLTERANDHKRFNTAILITDEGEIVLKYHKINLLEVEQPFYEVGHTLNVVDTPFGKVGVNICSDNYSDGLCIGHTLARMGAELILSPASWTVDHGITEAEDPYRDKWIQPLSSLAKLYDISVVSTTSVGYIVGGPYEGKKMVGCSLAVDNSGIVAQGVFNEFAGELVVADLTLKLQSIKGTQFGEMLKAKGFRTDLFSSK